MSSTEPTPKPTPKPPPEPSPDDLPITEGGLAELLINLRGNDLRYVDELQQWLAWDGCRWTADGALNVIRSSLRDVIHILWRHADASGDAERERQLRSIDRLTAHDRIIALASRDRRVRDCAFQLDQHQRLLCCENGVLDVMTWKLLPHDPQQLIPFSVPVAWDPNAQCPRWERFLSRTFEDDAELISYVQCCVGYTLTGTANERVMFVLHGDGRNGKTTLLETLETLFGSYARAEDNTLLTTNTREGNTLPNHDLYKARLVVVSELQEGQRLNEGRLKAVTGGDRLLMKTRGGRVEQLQPSQKYWMPTNHLPRIQGDDDAIWDRLQVIPFNVRITEEEQDRNLKLRFYKELPGILRWAAEGARMWIEHGLRAPAKVRAATQQYRHDQNPAAQFLDECCVMGPGKSVSAQELFDESKPWTERRGLPMLNQTALGRQLTRLNRKPGQNSKGQRVWRGIGLRSKEQVVPLTSVPKPDEDNTPAKPMPGAA